MGVEVEVSPQFSLVDDPVDVRVSGLHPGQPVTLAAMLEEGKLTYTSHAFYCADQQGTLDVRRDKSTGGSYTGVEAEGLLWSLAPSPDERRGVRVMKNDVTTPFHVLISVLDGHITASQRLHHAPATVLAQTRLQRSYLAPGVTRIPVREGAIRGTLFYPNTGGRYPGLVDLYGTAGGLVEYRAALLASRGFTVLAVAFFAYEDLPKHVNELRLEYFEEAVEWLSRHPRVTPGGVGAVGISKGSELAVSMSIHLPQVKAVVCISGCHMNCLYPTTYRGSTKPAALSYEVEDTEEGTRVVSWEEDESFLLPIEKAENTEFLFIHGTDDAMYPPAYCLRLVERLAKARRNNFELHIYPSAGHLIEPPYTPFCATPWHKVYKMYIVYGGKLIPHARAQEDMWCHLLSFLKRSLPTAQTPTQASPPQHSYAKSKL